MWWHCKRLRTDNHIYLYIYICQTFTKKTCAREFESHWYHQVGRYLSGFVLPNSDETNTWSRHQIETFPPYCPIVRGNPPVTGGFPSQRPITGGFPSQRPVTRSLRFSLICAWTNGWVDTRDAGDLRRHRTYYDVIVMLCLNQGIYPGDCRISAITFYHSPNILG